MIIFSVERFDRSNIDNSSATLEASKILAKSGGYNIMTGVYKGHEERAFITEQVELGRQLAREYGQESYLEQGHYGYWYLIDTMSGDILEIFKTIKNVSKEVAENTDNYNVLNGAYYIAVEY